jgi:GR25 family glycosyltransferase involved in LPS biosynthesis
MDFGVWNSHRAVAQHALARGHRRVLIVEDDVSFRRPIAELAPRIGRALNKLPVDWWGLYLGHMPIQAYFAARGLLRARSLCTHAYVANAPLLEWLAAKEPMRAEVPTWPLAGNTVDSAMSSLPGMYAVSPIVALQKWLGEYRVDGRIAPDGRRRGWHELDRWRNVFVFRGALVAEVAAILGSPFHWLTMERFLRRIEQGMSRDARNVRDAALFDDEYYLRTYPDVARAQVDPLRHYLEHGAAEGRWPNPSFDPPFYAAHAATLRPRENPLLHFIQTGKRLGYPTHPRSTAESGRSQ